MPTAEIVEQTYDQYELMVLQTHLDFYHQVPEVRSLTGFSALHTLLRANACARLAERGLIRIVGRLDREGSWQTIAVAPDDPLYQLVITGHFENAGSAAKPRIRFVNEVRFAGVQATLTEESIPEVVRLYKAGILKKNG